MNDVFKSVTVEEFKAFYARDFYNMFLPVWVATKAYAKDDIVYYTDNNFYKALVANTGVIPSSDTTKWQVVTGLSVFNYITDDDIRKAMAQALTAANEDFGEDDDEKKRIFLHLVAFFLVLDLKNASAGLNSSYAGLVASKSVGSVSTSYNFPQWIINSPLYSIYSQNGYGLKYLSLILPYLGCTVLFSTGRTTLA